MMFSLFKRKTVRNAAYDVLATPIKVLLLNEKQAVISARGGFSIENEAGLINGKALGYIFGFADCALQIAGLELKNQLGTFLLLDIIEALIPGEAKKYYKYLCDNMQTSDLIMEGVHLGIEEYKNFLATKGQFVTLGLIKCIPAL